MTFNHIDDGQFRAYTDQSGSQIKELLIFHFNPLT